MGDLQLMKRFQSCLNLHLSKTLVIQKEHGDMETETPNDRQQAKGRSLSEVKMFISSFARDSAMPDSSNCNSNLSRNSSSPDSHSSCTFSSFGRDSSTSESSSSKLRNNNSIPEFNSRGSSIPDFNSMGSSIPQFKSRDRSIPEFISRDRSVPEFNSRSSSIPEFNRRDRSIPESSNSSIHSSPRGMSTLNTASPPNHSSVKQMYPGPGVKPAPKFSGTASLSRGLYCTVSSPHNNSTHAVDSTSSRTAFGDKWAKLKAKVETVEGRGRGRGRVLDYQAKDIPSYVKKVILSSEDDGGLKLPCTAREMREILGSKKRRDPRIINKMDFKRKLEIVQTL